MKKQKLKISPGSIFILPIKDGKYGLGLVSISAKDCILAYYFDVILSSPSEYDRRYINIGKTVLIQRVSTLGFKKDKWKIIDNLESFVETEWPMPEFRFFEDLRSKFYSLTYDNKLNEVSRKQISREYAEKLYGGGMAGYVFAQDVLSKILSKISR